MPKEQLSSVALLLHPSDSVAIAKRPIKAGTELLAGHSTLIARNDIPASHKIALADIHAAAALRRYGQIIGFATRDIRAGEHVHTHNLGLKEFAREYHFCTDVRPAKPVPADQIRHFQGCLRPDGCVGTRNYIAIIPTVNCSATVCRHIARPFESDGLREYPNVDGVIALNHKGGCTMQPGEPQQLLARVLAGFARHPNVLAYIMVGLGCEANQIAYVQREGKLNVANDGEPNPAFINVQTLGGTAKTIKAGIDAVKALLPRANAAQRSSQPISKLILAENCGGSDGNSGITANPALGVASDELVRFGGTSALAETPEIYGAEHLLTRRAISREVGEKLLSFIRWWENHAKMWGADIDNNPSPGNKEGGLTTIFEKSLGAIAKAGQSPLSAVYAYAEKIAATGLVFMDTPGFDSVSMTGLVAGGCNIGVFTTGRGSVYGCKPAPCIKVATNTPLYEHMIDDMDINAGTILDGSETIEQVGQRIFEKIIAVASGERTKSELQNIGDEEFAPWPLGPMF